MKRFLVVALACCSLPVMAVLGTGGTAGAATPAASSSKFCNAVSNISSNLGSSSDTGSRSDAKALAKSIRNAAKSAPKNIKKAMNTMAEYYDAIGKAGSNPGAVAAATKKAAAYGKASATFLRYYEQHCIGGGS